MHIEPYLGLNIGVCGKSGFAENRGAVNRGFTVYVLKIVNLIIYMIKLTIFKTSNGS